MAIFLAIRAVQLSLMNVLYMSSGFLLVGVGFIGSLIFGLGLIFEEFFVTFGFLFVTFFTYSTFYKDRGLIPKLIIFSIVIVSIIHFSYQVYFTLEPNLLTHFISKLFDIIKTFMIFFWLGISSYRVYNNIKQENIHKWIKVRYKLISISAFILSIQAIPEICMPYDVEYGNPQDLVTFIIFSITLIIVLSFSFGFSFAWIMPKNLKDFIDRNYKEREFEDLNEIEIIELIKEDLEKKNT